MGRRQGEKGVTAMAEKLMKDPVCGMTMSPKEAAYASELRGMVYRFCSEACKEKFDRDPSRFFGRHMTPRGASRSGQ